MEILSEVSRPYRLDSFSDTPSITHFWGFSAHMLDFKLYPLEYLEETVGGTVTVQLENTVVDIPSSWHIMIVDRETYTIDMIPITKCASFDTDIFLFSPDDGKLATGKVKILDYKPKGVCFSPEIQKATAMIQSVGQRLFHGKLIHYGALICPYDLHRWIGDLTVGDILN